MKVPSIRYTKDNVDEVIAFCDGFKSGCTKLDSGKLFIKINKPIEWKEVKEGQEICFFFEFSIIDHKIQKVDYHKKFLMPCRE